MLVFVLLVVYFLFVMILCVLALATTICVMYLNSRAYDDPVIPIPDWVCNVSPPY